MSHFLKSVYYPLNSPILYHLFLVPFKLFSAQMWQQLYLIDW